MLGTIRKCPCCERWSQYVRNRHQNTAYCEALDHLNYLVSCEHCYRRSCEHWDAMWHEYWSSVL